MAGQWIIGFLGSYVLVSLLLYPLNAHLSTGAQVAIALPLALIGGWLRVQMVRHKQGRDSL
jgi:hypothetical protein